MINKVVTQKTHISGTSGWVELYYYPEGESGGITIRRDIAMDCMDISVGNPRMHFNKEEIKHLAKLFNELSAELENDK